jgi:hypothetical protein
LDGGKEYFSNQFNGYLQQMEIWRELSCRYKPKQNGVAERKNRSIVEAARAMLEEKSMPKFYWAEAVRTAVYIQNRIRDKVSAQEQYFGMKPNLRHLQVFGSIVYVHILKEKRRKLDAKAEKCILVGYSDEQKGYKCYNPRTKEACVSHDVVFDESASWYLPSTPQPEANLSSDEEVSEAEMPRDELEIRTRPKSPISVPLSGPSEGLGRFDQPDDEPASSGDLAVNSLHKKQRRRFTRREKGKRNVSDSDTQRNESHQSESDFEAQGGGTSGEKSALVEKTTTSGNARLRRSTRTKKPVERFGYNEYMAHHYAYMTRVAEVREPESYAEAAEDANWRAGWRRRCMHWRKMEPGTWLMHRRV